MSWMFPRRSGIRAPEPREWILGALYLPVFLFFLNFVDPYLLSGTRLPLTEPRNYFFANLLYMTVNFAVMLLIFRRTLWQSLREFEGKMLLSVLIGFGMCYGANLVLTTAYTVLDIMPENYNQEAVNSPARRLPAGHDALHRRARAAGGGVPVPRRAVCAAGAQMSPGGLCAVHVPVCGDACVPIPWLHDCGQYDPVPEPLSPGELLAVLGLSEDGQHLGLYFPAYVHQFPICARELLRSLMQAFL